MPLTEKGKKILHSMEESYESPKKAKEVFYASANKGTITGVHDSVAAHLNEHARLCGRHDDAGVAGIIAPSPTGLAAVRGRRPGE